MRKSDKKIEKNIVSALTEACEKALKLYQGFQWLTHLVNYKSFPDSLSIVCVFDTNEQLLKAIQSGDTDKFKRAIAAELVSHNIQLKGINKHIIFDTEEACEREHQGNWKRRLEGFSNARHV